MSRNRSSLQRVQKVNARGLRLVDFDPFCWVFFQGPVVVIVIIMIDGSEKCNGCLGYELQSV